MARQRNIRLRIANVPFAWRITRGVAVALGILGRVWSGPGTLLSHLDLWGTAALAGATSVLVNNLPAASLLAARTPHHPFALLIGLNLGPNLFVSGSLAWLLWLRSARAAGARPSIGKAVRFGVVAVPLSMAAAVGALLITGVAATDSLEKPGAFRDTGDGR